MKHAEAAMPHFRGVRSLRLHGPSANRFTGEAMFLFPATVFCLTLFALNSILCRAALVTWGMEPLQYTAMRGLSAAAVLALLCALHAVRGEAGNGSVWKQAWKQSSWTGALFLFLYMLSFSLAYMAIPSAAGTLVLNSAVQFAMMGWSLRQGQRPARQQLLGLGTALAGLLALLSPGLTAPPAGAAMLMAVAGLSWGGYSIVGRKATSAALATAGNFFRCAAACLFTALAAFLLENAPAPEACACALAAGGLASAFGYILWYVIVPRYSLVGSSVMQLGVPLITAALSALLLSEPVTLRLVLCSVPILGGICLALTSGGAKKGRT